MVRKSHTANSRFFKKRLKLQLHPRKISIKTIASGIDYLGWINFPDHRVLRCATKKKMMRTIRIQEGKKETVQSYLGMLSHGNAKILRDKIMTSIKDYNM
jgi:hypothetical protein